MSSLPRGPRGSYVCEYAAFTYSSSAYVAHMWLYRKGGLCGEYSRTLNWECSRSDRSFVQNRTVPPHAKAREWLKMNLRSG